MQFKQFDFNKSPNHRNIGKSASRFRLHNNKQWAFVHCMFTCSSANRILILLFEGQV